MTPSDRTWHIFRHGLATHSRTGYGDRILTAEVLPEGIPPIRTIGKYLATVPYDFGARSELIRCRQTADIVTELTGRPFTVDTRLNEQIDESFEAVRDRVRAFVDEMNASPHQHIWICTHGAIIAALKHLVTTGTFTRANENDYTQPGELLVIQGGAASVMRFA